MNHIDNSQTALTTTVSGDLAKISKDITNVGVSAISDRKDERNLLDRLFQESRQDRQEELNRLEKAKNGQIQTLETALNTREYENRVLKQELTQARNEANTYRLQADNYQQQHHQSETRRLEQQSRFILAILILSLFLISSLILNLTLTRQNQQQASQIASLQAAQYNQLPPRVDTTALNTLFGNGKVVPNGHTFALYTHEVYIQYMLPNTTQIVTQKTSSWGFASLPAGTHVAFISGNASANAGYLDKSPNGRKQWCTGAIRALSHHDGLILEDEMPC